MKRKTIRAHRDFITKLDDFKSSHYFFMVRAKKAKIPGDARYGIIVAKKFFKLAVQRNRAKRLVRDWISANEHLMNDNLDYIFVLRDTILNADCISGRKQMAYALRRILKMYENNAK